MSSGHPNGTRIPDPPLPKIIHDASPPPYTESESTSRPQPPLQTLATPSGASEPAGLYLPSPQNHHLFGPTPLSAQQLAPYAYYDPRSSYSMTQADARARWRFIAGFWWAVATWCIIGFLLGEVIDYVRKRE